MCVSVYLKKNPGFGMTVSVDIINGPNLNILDRRGNEYFGLSFEIINKKCAELADKLGMNIQIYQSNSEGDIINHIQSSKASALIINPAAYSHTSLAISDALYCFEGPIIEVHITNILSKKMISVTAQAVTGVICGLGINSYTAALEVIDNMLSN